MRPLFIILLSLFASFCHGQSIHYAAQFASGLGDGSSWANASYLSQAFIDAVPPGESIWVKWGSYRPSGFDRTLSFNLKKGVKMYGSFQGNETSLSQRDLSSQFRSDLSGEIGDLANIIDNSYHVVTAIDCDSTTLLDGFVIGLGYANGQDDNQDKGGGLLIINNNFSIQNGPKIKNCIFTQSQALYGGGLAIISTLGTIPAIELSSTSFEANKSKYGGGGIYTEGNVSPQGIMTLKDCYFHNNRAKFGLGGGINFEYSGGEFHMEGCRFFRDSTRSGFEGGGIFIGLNQFNFNLQIEDCKFEECYGAVGGGIFIRDNDDAIKTQNITIENSSFIKNISDNEGGGMAVKGGANTTENILLDSVIFEDNKAMGDAGGIDIGNSGQCVLNLEVKNSKFTNNDGGSPGAGAIRIYHYTGINTKNNVLIHNCLFNNNTGAYSITAPPPPYHSTCYTHILNSTFVNNSRYVFNKTWSPDFDDSTSYNFIDIYNSVIIDTTALKRIFYNNSFSPFTIHDYRVNHCLLSKPDCLFEGESVCGNQMLYNVDPDFEGNSFIPKPCSPLVNAGNNFWPDTFHIATDLLGGNRIVFDTVDIGAYEVTTACISDASFQPQAGGIPIFSILKNPLSEHEPLVILANQNIYDPLTMEVFDMRGSLLSRKSYPAGASQVFTIAPDLRAGVYVVEMVAGGKRHALRVLVAGARN